jgi:hypothetical protein
MAEVSQGQAHPALRRYLEEARHPGILPRRAGRGAGVGGSSGRLDDASAALQQSFSRVKEVVASVKL